MLRFTKMHGLGNDFVVIDGVTQPVRLTTDQIRKMGDRHRGVGFDQLLLVEPPGRPDVDFRYRIFNADGGEVEQCGNGARCFARFVRDQKLTQKRVIRVETARGIMALTVTQNGWVQVDMGAPELDPPHIPFEASERKTVHELEACGEHWAVTPVSMGNPHGVLVVDDVDTAPVDSVGPALESHPAFPARANISFMQVVSPDRVSLRVFERGVGETQACGSGACAAVVAGRLRGLLDERVTVELLGGELAVEWRGEGSPVIMEGPTARVFDGHIRLPGEKKRRSGRGGRPRKERKPPQRKGRAS